MSLVRCGSVLLALVCSTTPSAGADICGGEGSPCRVGLGEYHAAAPPEGAGPRPSVVHFHGAGGSGGGVIANRDLVDPFVARGYVVVAPTGLGRPDRPGGGWSFRPEGIQRRDELAFVEQVLDDATGRFHVDRSRVLLSGFSIGGSLVWYLACRAPGRFAAYAPVAGGFWRPHPDDCAGPVRLLHTHGWRDRTVPLEGRPLRGGALYQGDIFEGLQVWRRENGCAGLRADQFDTAGGWWRRWWTDCAPGTALELALHPGGHVVPADWPRRAIDWLERQTPPQ